MNAKVPYAWTDRQPWLELDFAPEEFQSRIAAAQAQLRAAGKEALLVWEDADRGGNVRYLSGFNMVWGTSVVLVHRDREPVLVTNAIAHGEPMHSNIQSSWMTDVRVSFAGTTDDLLAMSLDVLGQWRVAPDALVVAGLAQIPYFTARAMAARWSDAALVAGDAILDRLRRIKSPAEIAIIRRVADLTARAMEQAMDAAAVGASESDVAAAAHQACMAAGAERMSFGCFPVAGPRGALKNVFPSPQNIIRPDDLVVIDLGCKLFGYQSDMSRNVVAEPSPQVARILAATEAANDAAFAHVKPGVTTHSVIETMNAVIAERGFAAWDFTLCHGFGLDLTETPVFRNRPPLTLEAGMCFYVEPIIADESFGCACIEDMLLVTAEGCEKLSPTRGPAWR
ncbi:M24 family metallopeptidase [Kaistia nematophila]|uniref:Xaa-Pro peptidase family protein n=1 Tax=Kaistia nematophila TaxID=2994654 RepID=A0A9X3EBU3_9HYPH|nr:Xaa-Pro peptidase family protein [Kaistia nematophila]MCX5569965.1 Xaa-Pro peptidase family protein [Kaistia nematophila]